MGDAAAVAAGLSEEFDDANANDADADDDGFDVLVVLDPH